MASAGSLPPDFHLFSIQGIAGSLVVFLSTIVLYALGTGIYNVYFHPLSHIPGPLLARASGIPYSLRIRNGRILPWLQALHKQYGDAVRVTPTEVSFISAETAWQDIYGFHTGAHKTAPYLKDLDWFPPPSNGVYSIIAADESQHSKFRRNFSAGFADKSLRAQEKILQGFVDLLVHRLREEDEKGEGVVDIMKWYNYATFDVITDLIFGEPLYCLRDKDYHPWVSMVFQSAKAVGLIQVRKKYPLFRYYDKFIALFKDNATAIRTRQEFFNLSAQKVGARLENAPDRVDLFSNVIHNFQNGAKDKALTKEEMCANAMTFLIAGSETTATMLSGTTFLLLTNPRVYNKLVKEIRGQFSSQAEITMEAVNKLEYMIACLQEGLRMYPPVPTGLPRRVPVGGGMISGFFIPEKTSVYVSQHATNHSTRNYKDPDSYIPERWLGDPDYKDDNRAAHNPFSFGARNCLGKNLATAEMRLILAKMIFNFNLELIHQDENWLGNQKTFTLWEKTALMVKLNPVEN